MPDALRAALATDGLIWVVLAAFIASIVRGFSGFGTAMIYLPVAGQVLGPVPAIVTLTIMDTFGTLPAAPRAVREADWPDLRRLLLASALLLPVGLYLLVSVDPDHFRYAVSFITLAMLVALVFGLRYQGRLTPAKVYGVGATAGFLGGAVGLPGPVVVLFYMASTHRAHVIRATTLLFLLLFDYVLLAVLFSQGLLTADIVLIGAILVPAVMLGTLTGTAIFDPEREKLYRAVAYAIIAISALRGLPIWG